MYSPIEMSGADVEVVDGQDVNKLHKQREAYTGWDGSVRTSMRSVHRRENPRGTGICLYPGAGTGTGIPRYTVDL